MTLTGITAVINSVMGMKEKERPAPEDVRSPEPASHKTQGGPERPKEF
jgi:hypothetical protein